jgi:hypothetical protein
MKVIGLDNKEHKLKLTPNCNKTENRSDLHLYARLVLKEIYPFDTISEEVEVPGSDGLRFDFVLPLRKIVLEVQGQQHYNYIRHFHQSAVGFLASKKRDQQKREFCEINKLTLIELKYNERDNWREQIQSARL